RRQLPRPQGTDGDRVGPSAQPLLRHLQVRISRHAEPRIRRATREQPARAGRGQRAPLGAALGGRRLSRVSPAGRAGAGRWSLGDPRRPGLLEGVLPPAGSWCAQPVRRDDRGPGVDESRCPVRSQGTPWFARYGFSKDELAAIRAAEGWHTRYGARGPSSVVSGSAAGVPGEVYGVRTEARP